MTSLITTTDRRRQYYERLEHYSQQHPMQYLQLLLYRKARKEGRLP